MPGDLLGREDWLLNVEARPHLGQPRQQHVHQTLRVHGELDVPHATLDAVDYPALSEERDDWDASAGDVAAVLKHLAATE